MSDSEITLENALKLIGELNIKLEKAKAQSDQKKRQIENLKDKLDLKDKEILDLREQSEMASEHLDADPRPSLPVPRLELLCISESTHRMVYEYNLVMYSRLKMDYILIPMGRSEKSGSIPNPEKSYSFRLTADIMVDAQHLNLPAFLIRPSGKIQKIVNFDTENREKSSSYEDYQPC